jgi:hypothetical protein
MQTPNATDLATTARRLTDDIAAFLAAVNAHQDAVAQHLMRTQHVDHETAVTLALATNSFGAADIAQLTAELTDLIAYA